MNLRAKLSIYCAILYKFADKILLPKEMGTKLSVNINKIATIRNARGGNTPDVVQVAIDCETFGADGITVHPRPDERHITEADVMALSGQVKTEFNIEGYPNERFMALLKAVRPAQATLVPDPPHVLTSNAGWNIATTSSSMTITSSHRCTVRPTRGNALAGPLAMAAFSIMSIPIMAGTIGLGAWNEAAIRTRPIKYSTI